MAALDRLVAQLGMVFGNMRLLESALAHRSFVNERPAEAALLISGERLEFLGDAIVNYLAADLIYQRFPERNEGELTVLRTALIRTGTLAAFARTLNLGEYLRISKGEESSGARNRDSLLADSFEALIGAVYLDAGLDAARRLVLPLFEQHLTQLGNQLLDYKTQLQHRIQAERNITPMYRILSESGPEHRREYTIEVLAGNDQIGVGHGLGKQAATQDAARAALLALDTHLADTPEQY